MRDKPAREIAKGDRILIGFATGPKFRTVTSARSLERVWWCGGAVSPGVELRWHGGKQTVPPETVLTVET